MTNIISIAAAAVPLLAGFHPDPTITRSDDGCFYLSTSSFTWKPGLPIYKSRDLASWECVGHALAGKDAVLVDSLGEDFGVWAPTLRWHDGMFYLVFTCHSDKGRNYLTCADKAEGPWSPPRHIGGMDGAIDPALFFDTDGKVYILGNWWPPENEQLWPGQSDIWIQEFDLKSASLVGARHVISHGSAPGATCAEGPRLFKRNGKYILLVAEGGTEFYHSVAGSVADCPFGPYEPFASNPLLTRREDGHESSLQATGHADLVQLDDEEWFGVFLGKRTVANGSLIPIGRETFGCRVTFDGDKPVFHDDELAKGRVSGESEYSLRLPPGFAPNGSPFAHGAELRLRRVAKLAWEDEVVCEKPGEALAYFRSREGFYFAELRAGSVALVCREAGVARTIATEPFAGTSCRFAVDVKNDKAQFFCEAASAQAMHPLGPEVAVRPVCDAIDKNRFNGTGVGKAITIIP